MDSDSLASRHPQAEFIARATQIGAQLRNYSWALQCRCRFARDGVRSSRPSGVKLPPPAAGKASVSTRKRAAASALRERNPLRRGRLREPARCIRHERAAPMPETMADVTLRGTLTVE
jgi:hypothetical protein